MGRLQEAKDKLKKSFQIKRNIQDNTYLAETLNWLGMFYEMTGRNDKAERLFRKGLDSSRSAGRKYFLCGALTGLIRVKHAQGNYDDIPPLLKEAEQLANQYEYNDHLASLRLSQGHIAWEGKAPSWENGFDAALHYYQQALIYALRYNRFLLDEVLSGRLQGTPLRPVIPFCLQRGNEGREMLQRLHDWWQTGCNDVGMPRTDTISLIQEGIKLRDAETAARQREPGDGSPQKSVVEQIEEALQSASAH
jgi:tetratricopeptide (TPR) repeat protein